MAEIGVGIFSLFCLSVCFLFLFHISGDKLFFGLGSWHCIAAGSGLELE
jgi:hypothetical protein